MTDVSASLLGLPARVLNYRRRFGWRATRRAAWKRLAPLGAKRWPDITCIEPKNSLWGRMSRPLRRPQRLLRDITVVSAYYENDAMLQKHLEVFAGYDAEVKARLHVILVDDGSPTAPLRLGRETGVDIQTYRMLVNVPWNQDACRNLAVSQARTEWLILIDMDMLVPNGTLRRAMSGDLDPGVVYRMPRREVRFMEDSGVHPNCYLLTKAMFDVAGGYDERFAGTYGTDGDFRRRAGRVATIALFGSPLAHVPSILIEDAKIRRGLPPRTPEVREVQRRIFAERGDAPPLRGSFPWERVTR